MLKIIFWAVVIILLLSFFGISLQSVATSPIAQQNFGYVWQVLLQGWNFLVNLFNPFIAVLSGALNTVVANTSH